jgi:hypothetical protein
MNAVQKLIKAVADRLGADAAAELEAQYRADAAADSRASRQRTVEAQKARRARGKGEQQSEA